MCVLLKALLNIFIFKKLIDTKNNKIVGKVQKISKKQTILFFVIIIDQIIIGNDALISIIMSS